MYSKRHWLKSKQRSLQQYDRFGNSLHSKLTFNITVYCVVDLAGHEKIIWAAWELQGVPCPRRPGLGWLRFGEFPRLVGCYCSYLLPKQDGGTSQIQVNKTQSTRTWDALNTFARKNCPWHRSWHSSASPTIPWSSVQDPPQLDLRCRNIILQYQFRCSNWTALWLISKSDSLSVHISTEEGRCCCCCHCQYISLNQWKLCPSWAFNNARRIIILLNR